MRLPRPFSRTAVQRAATRANAATALGAAAVLVLASASAAAAFGGDSGETHLTLQFTRTVGLYAGSSVRMLGVSVGSIDSIKPMGTFVDVKVTVKSGVKVPADATATIVPPSLVADRYVQIDVYHSGATLADGATIALDHTQVPVEKDELLASLDKLDVALGPTGANSTGALSRLVTVGTQNLDGEGAQINKTLRDVTALVTALDDNGAGINGTVDQLNSFTTLLLKNDSGIQALSKDLATVSAQLDDDRKALATAFSSLAVATKELGNLVRGARTNLKGGVSKLVDITNILVQERTSIEELIDTAPQGLTNLAGAYGPSTQTLDVRNNLPTSDSSGLGLLVCTALGTAGVPSTVAGPLCGAVSGITVPTTPGGTIPGSVCAPSAVATTLPNAVPTCLSLPTLSGSGTGLTGVSGPSAAAVPSVPSVAVPSLPVTLPSLLPSGLPVPALLGATP